MNVQECKDKFAPTVLIHLAGPTETLNDDAFVGILYEICESIAQAVVPVIVDCAARDCV